MDVLKDLGQSVHRFKTIRGKIDLEDARTMSTERLIDAMNEVYQSALNEIMDNLILCRDMKLAHTAIDGIRKGLDNERGFKSFDH